MTGNEEAATTIYRNRLCVEQHTIYCYSIPSAQVTNRLFRNPIFTRIHEGVPDYRLESIAAARIARSTGQHTAHSTATKAFAGGYVCTLNHCDPSHA